MALCTIALMSGSGARAQTPVVFRVSEGVRPQSLLSLYGEYLTGTPQVRFFGADGKIVATQTAVQADPAGHFCRVVFPRIAAGVYRLSVRNSAGWSAQKLFVNRAEPRWISEERAYPGLRLKLIGRNLDGWELGAARRTRVRLTPTSVGRPIVIQPDAVTPYCIDFTTPGGVAIGSYRVEVSTGAGGSGAAWQRLDNHSEYPSAPKETILTVEKAPRDSEAAELGVAWANDFEWGRRVDAKARYGAAGDGVTDDTKALQTALDDTARRGGGVVLLPRGSYRVSGLTLGERTVLRGEGRAATSLHVSNTGAPAIRLQGRRHGLSALTLRFQPTVPASADGMLLGGNADQTFLHNVFFDLLRTPDVSAHQGAYYFEGPGPLLVAGCRFAISSKNLWDHAVRSHVTFRDNFIDMHDGLGLCMSSEKLLLLNNELVFHPAEYSGQMNGFFVNEGWMGWNIYNAYIANNNAHDLLGKGDCQPFAADSAWSCFAGAAVASGPDWVDVRCDLTADFKGLDTHETEALLVQGRGLGQLRRTVAHRSLGGNPAVVRLTVSPPWDVAPDTSSLVTVGCWHLNHVFDHNRASASRSPYNMYYGGCFDCIDADAASENTEGWCNWGRIGESANASWHTPVYFSQLRRSRFTGKAAEYGTMGITLRVENETVNYRGIADYGAELRDNTIDRSASPNRSQRLAGNAAIAAYNQNWMKTTPPLIVATLCESNTIKNSAVGFDLNRTFAFAIRGTVYENCPKPVNDSGFDTALLPGAGEPLKPRPRSIVTKQRLPAGATVW